MIDQKVLVYETDYITKFFEVDNVFDDFSQTEEKNVSASRSSL